MQYGITFGGDIGHHDGHIVTIGDGPTILSHKLSFNSSKKIILYEPIISKQKLINDKKIAWIMWWQRCLIT